MNSVKPNIPEARHDEKQTSTQNSSRQAEFEAVTQQAVNDDRAEASEVREPALEHGVSEAAAAQDRGLDSPSSELSAACGKAANDTSEFHDPPDAATAKKASKVIRLSDFYAVMSENKFIYRPTRELWPDKSVDARLGSVFDGNQKISASKWLAKYRPVEQLVWAPGLPELIEGRYLSDGGWIERVGGRGFNLYRPPTPARGDASQAGSWIEHVRRVYPDEADHIIDYLAFKVQRPGVKINHALVLGGGQGIGKDTILEPVRYAVGPWNFAEVAPRQLLGRFNPFVRSVILRISEARDLGEADRVAFYEQSKTLIAAPPDTLLCDQKYLREIAVLNVGAAVFTTNNKQNGLFLPADDRRHFVAWSPLTKEEFDEGYWRQLWHWYENEGGYGHVAAYLAERDLSHFDPKAPPRQTPAFHEIVDANRASEEAELADLLDSLGNPIAITLDDIVGTADDALAAWFQDPKNRRQVPHRMESVGFVPVRNPGAKDGLWKCGGRRQAAYAVVSLSPSERLAAVTERLNQRGLRFSSEKPV